MCNVESVQVIMLKFIFTQRIHISAMPLCALQFESLHGYTIFTSLTNTVIRQQYRRKYKSIKTQSHSHREVAEISHPLNALDGTQARVPRVC